MKVLIKFKPPTFIVMFITAFTFLGCSKGPAPYSQEAIEKLTSAAQKVVVPVLKPGMTPCDRLKMAYKAVDGIYSEAGYSLEKSIIQLKETDPQYRENSPVVVAVNAVFIPSIYSLHEAAKQENLKLEECIPRKAAIAINDIFMGEERAATLNTNAKAAFIAAQAYILETDYPAEATITDCAVLVFNDDKYIYQHIENVTCSANMSLNAGSITITGPTEWRLTKNTFSVDYEGKLDKAIQ